ALEVHPPSGAPPRNQLVFSKIPPNINNQKPNEFKNGNATSRAPICNGNTAFIIPNIIGIAARNIMVVPCIVIISLYKPALIKSFSGLINRSEEHTSELQSRFDLVCRLLLEKKKRKNNSHQ